MTEPICPAYAVAHMSPEFVASLSDAERFVLPHLSDFWMRPDQRWPSHAWRSVGHVGGRGAGKSTGIGWQINRRIERGEIRSLILLAPTLERVSKVQLQLLIDTSPPWFRPERAGETIVYPNGLTPECHSAEAPGRPRGSSFDFGWATELVDYAASTRSKAFANFATTVRSGPAQYVWDTTSQGVNEIIMTELELSLMDPMMFVLLRGTTFDNPMLTRSYILSECLKYHGQAFVEEILGRVLTKAGDALWTTDILRANQRHARPSNPALTLVSVDPALSAAKTSDETGIVIGDRGQDGHSYVHTDETGRHAATVWPGIVVDWCDGTKGEAAGVIIERNAGGDLAAHAVVAEARERGMGVEYLARDAPFPARRPGLIFVKEIQSATSKGARATGPAAETGLGRVHHVNRERLGKLETQLTTYVPGAGGKSPDRYDAYNQLVTELAGLAGDHPGKKVDARETRQLQEELRKRLLTAARGRRVGL